MPQLPLPDSEISTNDRYQIAWLYRFPPDLALFFVKCPPILTALATEPVLTALALEPSINSLALEPALASIATEPSLLATTTEPTLEAEDCLS